MRKNKLWLLLVTLGLIFPLTACAKPTNSPESVGREALTAWYKGDVAGLLSLSAPDNRGTHQRQWFEYCRGRGAEESYGYGCFGFGTQQRVYIQEVVVRGDVGVLGNYVTVVILYTADGQDRKTSVFVEKIDGQWYIGATMALMGLGGMPE